MFPLATIQAGLGALSAVGGLFRKKNDPSIGILIAQFKSIQAINKKIDVLDEKLDEILNILIVLERSINDAFDNSLNWEMYIKITSRFVGVQKSISDFKYIDEDVKSSNSYQEHYKQLAAFLFEIDNLAREFMLHSRRINFINIYHVSAFHAMHIQLIQQLIIVGCHIDNININTNSIKETELQYKSYFEDFANFALSSWPARLAGAKKRYEELIGKINSEHTRLLGGSGASIDPYNLDWLESDRLVGWACVRKDTISYTVIKEPHPDEAFTSYELKTRNHYTKLVASFYVKDYPDGVITSEVLIHYDPIHSAETIAHDEQYNWIGGNHVQTWKSSIDGCPVFYGSAETIIPGASSKLDSELQEFNLIRSEYIFCDIV